MKRSFVTIPKMQFEYDPESLIEEIRKRPGIWDFDHRDYRIKNLKQNLWNEVVMELLKSNDATLTKAEMRELELQLQKKWKSIRDCFQKYIQNPNRTKRPYLYYQRLQFLIKNTDESPKELEASSESDTGNGSDKKSTWKSKRKLQLSKETETSDEENDYEQLEDTRSNYSVEASEVIPSKAPRMSKSNEFAFASVEVLPKTETDDCDKMFLLSLMPHLKAIPEEYRLNVKMELMQVLQNAQYNTGRDRKFV